MTRMGYRELATWLSPEEPRARTYRSLYCQAAPRLLRARYGVSADGAATQIQRAWRLRGHARVRRLRGALAFQRGLADNREDPWTLTAVEDIPLSRFWSYRCAHTGRWYAMDVLAAHRWFCHEEQGSPYDRTLLLPEARKHLERCHEVSCEMPRVQAFLRREGPIQDPGLWTRNPSESVFRLLDRTLGLLYSTEALRTMYLELSLPLLYVLWQDLRWWILQFGPKHVAVAPWLREDAQPRHRGNLSSCRQFVMRGLWTLLLSIKADDRGTVLFMFSHLVMTVRNGGRITDMLELT